MPAKNSRSEYDGQNKRFIRFRVLEILNDYSDGDHHLKHTEIVKKLSSLYGLYIDRKSIRNCVDDINELGRPYNVYVSSEKGDGAFLLSRMFERSEIRFLIDSIYSNKSIDQKQAEALACKLQKFLCKRDRKSLAYLLKNNGISRTDNSLVFYNVETILDAIEKNKKITFNYNRFYLDQQQNEKRKNMLLVASPYHLINSQGKYYLVCNNDKFDDLANYRVDRMLNVEIADQNVKPIETLKNCQGGFDVTKYLNNNIYMFSDNPVDVKLKIDDDYTVSYVQDWFGVNANIYRDKNSNKIYADVCGNEQAIIYWCLQYGETIELVEPLQTREKIKKIVDKMKQKY